jgi:hypothetical protein
MDPAAIQERKGRFLDYCRKNQEKDSMPDSIREDIRRFTLEAEQLSRSSIEWV